jgi:NitT/TauT family transport system substrate-binding protein
MKTKVRILSVLLLSALVLPSALFARGRADTGELSVYVIGGPSGVGMIRMFERPPEVPGHKVGMKVLAGNDLLAASFLSGEAKIGILAPNVAASIHASGRDLRVLAVIGNGMLSLLTSDPELRNVAGLRGRTVQVAGQGATPDFVFRRILASRGLTPDRDVRLDFSLAYPEIALSLIAGRIDTALLPEPFATMARNGNPGIGQVADVRAEWELAGGQGNFPMTLLVADGAFADANPEAVAAILDAVRDSIEWVTANPAEAGLLVQKHNLGLTSEVAAAAIPRSNYVFVPAAEARPSIEALFRIFMEYSPDSIGGGLPSDRFYGQKD